MIVLEVYDESQEIIAEIDTAKVLWVERYDSVGEFTIEVPATQDNINIFKPMRNIVKKSPIYSVGIIETVELSYSATESKTLKITGKTADTVLTWRVHNGYATIEDYKTLDCIKDFLSRFKGDRLLPIKIEGTLPNYNQTNKFSIGYQWKTPMNVIQELIKPLDAGFSIVYTPKETTRYTLHFYKGTDKKTVIFSPDFESLSSATYLQSVEGIATSMYITGDGEGRKQLYGQVHKAKSGFDRIERFIDGSDVRKDADITENFYKALLNQKGNAELRKCQFTSAFAGDVALTSQWAYGEDYKLGDRVTVEVKEWSLSELYRIVEITEQQDEAGYQLQPTFAK